MPNGATRERDEARSELVELRQLLVGPAEADALAAMRARIEALEARHERIERLAADLPEALKTRAARDEELTAALATPVERALKLSVARDPQPLVDAVFPVIGPAIRKAVLAAIQGMMQGLNAVLENSLSPRAVGWRFEALRTGRSFSEVALLRSLVYRVEQVFLIHRETGLVLHHATATAIVAQDADMVSGMLTAIQDFVRDSFRVQDGADLDTMQVGELHVWLERSSGLVLAAVIRGTAPAGLRHRIQDTLGEVARRFGVELDDFDGDPAPFAPSQPLVDALLESQQQPPARWGRYLLLTLVVAAAAWLVWALWPAPPPEPPEPAPPAAPTLDAGRWAALLEDLSEEPGIIVLAADPAAATIVALRDPLAADPAALVRAAGLGDRSVEVREEAFASLDPAIVLRRARARLAPPPEVALELAGELLVASGEASHAWLSAARRLAWALPGVAALDTSRVVDLTEAQWRPTLAALAAAEISFPTGSSELGAAQDDALAQARAQIAALERLAHELERFVVVEIRAHHDPSGTPRQNAALRRDRADNVLAALQSPALLRTRLVAPPPTAAGARLDERVATFHVVVPGDPTPQEDPR